MLFHVPILQPTKTAAPVGMADRWAMHWQNQEDSGHKRVEAGCPIASSLEELGNVYPVRQGDRHPYESVWEKNRITMGWDG